MLARLIFFLAVFFTVSAFDFQDILASYPEFEECMPTFKMFDASAKLPNGLGSGHFVDLGNFDQCLEIDERNNSEIIKGKYCIVKVVIPMELLGKSKSLDFKNNFRNFFDLEHEMPKIEERVDLEDINQVPGLTLGWCIPHTCPITNFTTVLSSFLQTVIHPKMLVVPVDDGVCQVKEDLKNDYNPKNIIFITFLAATLFLMIISTLYDMYIQYWKQKPAHIILIAFSVKTNGQKLLSVSNNPDQLQCLNGIRFISMMWVILGHRFSSAVGLTTINLTYMSDFFDNAIHMYIISAPVSVDTFFVLSGILVGYGFCLAKSKGVKFNIILFYVHRYLRLTPVVAVVVWFTTTIFVFFGSGPLWPVSTAALANPCIDHWWAHLVYIQNYYNVEQFCLGHTWYLAIDMQLYILSPIILIPLWKWPKQTLFASVILILGSIASSFAITYEKDLISFAVAGSTKPYMKYYYYATHVRFGPWLMGIMLGYYLFKLRENRNSRISLHPVQVAFGWIVGMGLLLSTVFAGHDLSLNPDKLGNSFFNGFHRHGWALGLCWVIYACTQGYGGPVNTFLSWSVFQVLGRFTYSVYLVHVIVQFAITSSVRTDTYFSEFDTYYAYWGDFMISFAISVFVTLAYESPMVTIEKVLFKTGHKPKQPELPVHQNPVPSKNKQ